MGANMKLSFIIISFLFLWTIFAFWDVFGDSDEVKVYPISRTTSSPQSDGYPQYLPARIHEYKVLPSGVLYRGVDDVIELSNCSVFDVDNWTCSWADGSATFGMRNGEHYRRSVTDNVIEWMYVSRFRYVILECQWQFADLGKSLEGSIQPIVCALIPFLI